MDFFLRVNPPIRQTLAAEVLQRHGGALRIIKPESLTRVPAEVELGHVALEVGFADTVECASQAALEQREGRFDGVRRRDDR